MNLPPARLVKKPTTQVGIEGTAQPEKELTPEQARKALEDAARKFFSPPPEQPTNWRLT